MLSGVILIAAAQQDPPPEHTFALWTTGILAVLVCSALFLYFIALTKPSWTPLNSNAPLRSIARERAEKSCDTVLSVCTFLITATLGLITWLNDKVGPGAYILPLIVALLYFFILLAFTIHLRFNFFWRREDNLLVSSAHNLRFGYWLTTANSAIVLGLALLAVPVLELGFGLLKLKPPTQPDLPLTKVEVTCHVPAPPPPQPPPQPCQPVKHHHHKPCACKK